MMAKLWGMLWRGALTFVLTILSSCLLSNGVCFVLNHHQMQQHYDMIYSPLVWICGKIGSYNVVMIIFILWIILLILDLGVIASFYSLRIWKRRWHKGLLWFGFFLEVIQNWVRFFILLAFQIPCGMEVFQAVGDEMKTASLEQIQEGIPEDEIAPQDDQTPDDTQ